MIAARGISVLLVASLVIIAACGEGRKTPARDTTAITPAEPPVLPVIPANLGWDSTAGPALFIAVSESPHGTLVVLPSLTDSAVAAAKNFEINQLSGLQVDLFGRRGRTGSASIAAQSQAGVTEGCVSWPKAQLSGATSTDWRIALEKGRAGGIRLDSLEGLSPEDSAELARQITTVASSIHTKSDSVFAGIPFAVRHAYRFSFGPRVVFTDVVRKINEEANPREERVVLVLERGADGSYVSAYQSRSAGPEEELQTTELLAAVSFISRHRPGIFISSEYEDGGRIVLLERVGDMQWRSTWRSAYTGC